MTARRREELEDYFAATVLREGRFVCRHAAACRAAADARGVGAYHEGQLSYLGSHYDLSDSGVPLRILVAAMDTGHPPPRVTMTERAAQITASQRAGFRGRNQHMKGTTLALRLAFGRDVADAEEHVEVAGRRVPLFDCFAMANLLLCSAVDASGGKKSLGTKVRTMRTNCVPHLTETIRILEPTMLVSQGVDVGRELARVLGTVRRLDDRVAEVHLGGRPFCWVDLRHPSRNWFSPTQPYAQDVAIPALIAGRQLALEIAAG